MTALPGVPDDGAEIALPCGETVAIDDLNLGMRSLACECGATHTVVLDPHPPTRFLPESVTAVLEETVEPVGTEAETFDTNTMMALLLEAYPERIAAGEAAEDGTTGFAVAWIADWEPRTLHERIVETVLEVMADAVSQAGDEGAVSAFTRERAAFDIEEFVEAYREVRDFEDEFDEPV